MTVGNKIEILVSALDRGLYDEFQIECRNGEFRARMTRGLTGMGHAFGYGETPDEALDKLFDSFVKEVKSGLQHAEKVVKAANDKFGKFEGFVDYL